MAASNAPHNTPAALVVDFDLWVGGVMRAAEGGNSPIARNTMAAQLVAHGRLNFKREDCDVIVIVVPGGSGDAFMDKWVGVLGENPAQRGRVYL